MIINKIEYNDFELDLQIKATLGLGEAKKLADAFVDVPHWRWAEFAAGIPIKVDDFAALLRGKGSDAMSRVIFAPPATIVFWEDGTKTVVKCENEPFDAEKGIAMAVAKKMLTSKDYNRLLDTAFDYRESVCIDNSHHTRERRRKHGKRTR